MTQTYVITGHADETTTVLAVYSDKDAAAMEYHRLQKLSQDAIDSRKYDFRYLDGISLRVFELDKPYSQR